MLSPEHAHMVAAGGWDKQRIKDFVFAEAVRSRDSLDHVGKGAVPKKTRWRVPRDHPDAVLDESTGETPDMVHVVKSPQSIVVVAGTPNAGVSAVVETFGPRGDRPALAAIKEP